MADFKFFQKYNAQKTKSDMAICYCYRLKKYQYLEMITST